MNESFRISDDDKIYLKSLKRWLYDAIR
jgi:hypothetical protein